MLSVNKNAIAAAHSPQMANNSHGNAHRFLMGFDGLRALTGTLMGGGGGLAAAIAAWGETVAPTVNTVAQLAHRTRVGLVICSDFTDFKQPGQVAI